MFVSSMHWCTGSGTVEGGIREDDYREVPVSCRVYMWWWYLQSQSQSPSPSGHTHGGLA